MQLYRPYKSYKPSETDEQKKTVLELRLRGYLFFQGERYRQTPVEIPFLGLLHQKWFISALFNKEQIDRGDFNTYLDIYISRLESFSSDFQVEMEELTLNVN